MHLPPAVQVHCPASQRARWAVAGLVAGAVASLVAWAAGHAGAVPSMQAASAMAAAVGALALCLLSTHRAARVRHRLAWDGQGWWHAADGSSPTPIRIQPMIDLDTGVLVRFERLAPAGPGGSVWGRTGTSSPRWAWLAIESRDAGPAFRAWCAALYATARVAAESRPIAPAPAAQQTLR